MYKQKKKVVVLGEPTVGKTSLLSLYCSEGQQFPKDYVATQAADVQSKVISVQDNQDIELFFFDIGGQDIYSEIINPLMKGADLSMIMYDISNRESFNKIAYWFDLLKKQNGKNIPGALVANKSDLKGLRQVEMAEGHELAKKLNMEFFEVSAARHIDVDHPFTYLSKL